MRAFLKNYRQSPRKVRLVADLIRGKRVTDALTLLAHTPKRATNQLAKLLHSARANAVHNDDAKGDELIIKDIRVDEGTTLSRTRPRAMGRAARIRKRTSNVSLELEKK